MRIGQDTAALYFNLDHHFDQVTEDLDDRAPPGLCGRLNDRLKSVYLRVGSSLDRAMKLRRTPAAHAVKLFKRW